MTATKVKVSLTLSADLLQLVDRDARRRRDTRSGVVEEWLRRAASVEAAMAVEDATVLYYMSLRAPERAEEEALGRSLSDAARNVSYDDAGMRRRRARR